MMAAARIVMLRRGGELYSCDSAGIVSLHGHCGGLSSGLAPVTAAAASCRQAARAADGPFPLILRRPTDRS
ncbi:hypothetical protein WK09_22995 [Burkholderia ubonensis]|nr:hypothetical protein WI76_33070 [Burkholderia ubonensis]KVP29913.1 hypothetical protein WJ88_12655 [Burkholderia ubonensis]KVP87472.1 hypothetical protein WJ97_28880 [Burkholderia ubonensis]KVR10407.1 hypothetical protein WK09_22995 [Burkholderia ubonensis]KVR50363.1 hypothetical protein WK19_01210 [Burkholderia ubonensis]